MNANFLIFAISLQLLASSAPGMTIVFWADGAAEPPTKQTASLKHAGKLLYGPLEFCGGTCVWIGGKWVMTARHGVRDWTSESLRVSFPGHDLVAQPVIAVPPRANFTGLKLA